MNVPRMLYRGAPDETADTKRFETEAEVETALAAGWRLTRAVQAPEPESEPLKPLRRAKH